MNVLKSEIDSINVKSSFLNKKLTKYANESDSLSKIIDEKYNSEKYPSGIPPEVYDEYILIFNETKELNDLRNDIVNDYNIIINDNNRINEYNKLIESLITGRNKIGNNGLIYAQLDIVSYVKERILNPSDAEALVTELSDLLYPESIDSDRKDYFIENLLEGFPAYYWTDAWYQYLNTDDNTVVKSRLEALLSAIINAAEKVLKRKK